MTVSLEWVVAALRSPFERSAGRPSTAVEEDAGLQWHSGSDGPLAVAGQPRADGDEGETREPRGADDETVAAAVAALEHPESRHDRRSPPDIDGGADDRTVAVAVAAVEGRDVPGERSPESRPTPPDIDGGADDETVAAAVARVDPGGDTVVQADGGETLVQADGPGD